MDNKYVKLTENETKGDEHWLTCLECRVETVHRVISSVDGRGDMSDYLSYVCQWVENYQVIQCQGCKSLSFRHESASSDGPHAEEVELYSPRSMLLNRLPDAA